MQVESIKLPDLLRARSPQAYEPLNTPEDRISKFSPSRQNLASALYPQWFGTHAFVARDSNKVLASCYVRLVRQSDEARLVALCSFTGNPVKLAAAWERTLQAACFFAAMHGKTRVVASAEDGSDVAILLRKVGFTTTTREHLLYKGSPTKHGDVQSPFAQLGKAQEWDAWKLYNATEPALVKRAEGMTATEWADRRRSRYRSSQEWALRHDDKVVLLLEAAFGRSSCVLNLFYYPDCSHLLPSALTHAQMQCELKGIRSLYWLVRDHQPELYSLLSEEGFVAQREQMRLVFYTTLLNRQRAVGTSPQTETAANLARTNGTSQLISGLGETSEPTDDWYNYKDKLNGTESKRF